MNIVICTKQWKIVEVAAKLEAFAIANRDISSEFYVHLCSLAFIPFTEVYSNSTQRIRMLKLEVRIIIKDALGMIISPSALLLAFSHILLFTAEITKNPKINMNYPHFHEKITVPYRIGLVGWEVPFVNPSILSEEHLKQLIKAWKEKLCYFKKLNAQEMKAHEAQFEADIASGKVGWATRKTRKDKGGRHGKSKDTISDDDSDDEGEEEEQGEVEQGGQEVVALIVRETRIRKPSAKRKAAISDSTGNNDSGDFTTTARPRQHCHRQADSSAESQSSQRKKSSKRHRKDELTEGEHPKKRTRTSSNKRVPT
jgi:hypothetical protein